MWKENDNKSFGGSRDSSRRFGPKPGPRREDGFRNDRFGSDSRDRKGRKSFGDDARSTRRSFGDKPERGSSRFDRPARFDRPERSEKPARFDRPQRPARPMKPANEEFRSRDYRDYEQRTPVVEAAADEERQYILAGRNPIREAIKSGRDIEKLLVQKGELSGSAREIVAEAKEARIPVQVVEKSRLDNIMPHHQGLLAFASAYKYSTVEEMLANARERNEKPFLILLDSVTDPHNLGAVIRSAECVGAHGVIVPERRSVGLTPAAVKASAGAVEHMPVARVTNLNRTIEELKEQGVWVYALTMDGEDYRSVDFEGGVALIVGSEGEGISRLTLENCDRKVSLPMKGHIDSLNASVAAGVVMYAVLASRQA